MDDLEERIEKRISLVGQAVMRWIIFLSIYAYDYDVCIYSD